MCKSPRRRNLEVKFQIPKSKSQINSKHQIPFGCAELLDAQGKAALKRPDSKRFAKFEALGAARQRLECGRFSTALEPCETTARCTDFGASGLNAKAQRRKGAEKKDRKAGREIVCTPQSPPPLSVSAPLRLCVKICAATTLDVDTKAERGFPNRRGAERSTVPHRAGPLHRADDEGFRKIPCAGKWRGVKRPEGRAP